MSHLIKRKLNSGGEQGFTLVEMIVSLGIIAIILGILVAGQSTYTAEATLRNAVDEIEVNLRTAQTYGISVKGLQIANSPTQFDIPYGLSVKNWQSDETLYVFFADVSKNFIYNGDRVNCPSVECVELIRLPSTVVVNRICFNTPVYGAENCQAGGNTNRTADITFLRPQIRADIRVVNQSGGTTIPTRFVRIELRSISSGLTRSVCVFTNGQISIRKQGEVCEINA
jgi:prepilin-type N-terminal cleavage/methylation domain-containing protein